ncbi:putative mfs transporter [Diaporthe ampelina]|uniref:Putative mfs transporter n=1 Tax=Diaporthe ampelina TaxID=1214573 RepID=A0A0G2H8B5_9PEZI|nr:putative mfs transporter [Diaporthe ampelina]
MAANEKASPTTPEPEDDSGPTSTHLAKRVITKDELHEYRENDGYVLDAENSDGGHSETGVKLAADGHTRLIPQPSDDPKDPLNWSWRKKHTILFIVAAAAFLPDYGSATGSVTLIPQAAKWNMTPDEVNHSQAGNVFMLGAGGIFAVILSAYFGRLPVAFYFLVVAFATAAWCAGAVTFESFMGARILNGFFSTVTQGGGMMFIQDMFFFHERARKINIWASFFVMSPYMGPLLAAFMTAFKPWPIPFWVYTAETGAVLLLTIFLLDETYYDRRIPAAEQPDLGSQFSRLVGISQFRSRRLRNSFPQACMRVVKVVLKPTVLLTTVYYLLTFAWVVGINTTLSIFLTPLYNFGPLQIGYFYFTPVVAVLLGEMSGHFLHDFVARNYIKTHKGHFEPEVRLRAIFFSLPLMIVGLVLVGQALENAWHFMALSVSWGLYVYGIMITTVAVSSYCLDSYPEASGEVSAHLNNARTLGGFIVSYFQVQWAEKQGTKVSFGIQAAVVAAAFGIILFLMVVGKRLRIWAGPLRFATA